MPHGVVPCFHPQLLELFFIDVAVDPSCRPVGQLIDRDGAFQVSPVYDLMLGLIFGAGLVGNDDFRVGLGRSEQETLNFLVLFFVLFLAVPDPFRRRIGIVILARLQVAVHHLVNYVSLGWLHIHDRQDIVFIQHLDLVHIGGHGGGTVLLLFRGGIDDLHLVAACGNPVECLKYFLELWGPSCLLLEQGDQGIDKQVPDRGPHRGAGLLRAAGGRQGRDVRRRLAVRPDILARGHLRVAAVPGLHVLVQETDRTEIGARGCVALVFNDLGLSLHVAPGPGFHLPAGFHIAVDLRGHVVEHCRDGCRKRRSKSADERVIPVGDLAFGIQRHVAQGGLQRGSFPRFDPGFVHDERDLHRCSGFHLLQLAAAVLRLRVIHAGNCLNLRVRDDVVPGGQFGVASDDDRGLAELDVDRVQEGRPEAQDVPELLGLGEHLDVVRGVDGAVDTDTGPVIEREQVGKRLPERDPEILRRFIHAVVIVHVAERTRQVAERLAHGLCTADGFQPHVLCRDGAAAVHVDRVAPQQHVQVGSCDIRYFQVPGHRQVVVVGFPGVVVVKKGFLEGVQRLVRIDHEIAQHQRFVAACHGNAAEVVYRHLHHIVREILIGVAYAERGAGFDLLPWNDIDRMFVDQGVREIVGGNSFSAFRGLLPFQGQGPVRFAGGYGGGHQRVQLDPAVLRPADRRVLSAFLLRI